MSVYGCIEVPEDKVWTQGLEERVVVWFELDRQRCIHLDPLSARRLANDLMKLAIQAERHQRG